MSNSHKPLWACLGLIFLVACIPGPLSPEATSTPVLPAGLPQREPAKVEAIEIYQIDTFPVEVNVIARGNLPDSCTTIDQIQQTRNGSNFKIAIDSIAYSGASCLPGSAPFEEVIALDTVGLPAGIYVVEVNGLQGSFKIQVDNIPDDENAVLGGLVWLDQCELTGSEDAATAFEAGCLDRGDGSYGPNGSPDPTEPGIGEVIVDLGTGACPAAGLATTITDESGMYLFSGLKAGVYCLSIAPLSDHNRPILTFGDWTAPRSEKPGQVTISIEPGSSKLDLNFGWDNQLEQVPVINQGPDEPCTDKAIFLADITIPDDTVILPGGSFTKTWQLQNIGSCTWTSEYRLVQVEGAEMDKVESFKLPQVVAPGDEIEISVTQVAPLEPGTYRSDWKIQNSQGFLFGIGPSSDRPFWLQIVVR